MSDPILVSRRTSGLDEIEGYQLVDIVERLLQGNFAFDADGHRPSSSARQIGIFLKCRSGCRAYRLSIEHVTQRHLAR